MKCFEIVDVMLRNMKSRALTTTRAHSFISAVLSSAQVSDRIQEVFIAAIFN